MLMLAEKLFLSKYIEKSKILRHIYVMLMVIIGFVIFNASSMSQAVSDIAGMIPHGKYPLVNEEFTFYLKNNILVLIFAIIGATPVIKIIVNKLSSKNSIKKICNLLEPILLLVILIIITAYLVDGSFNPFLYFGF